MGSEHYDEFSLFAQNAAEVGLDWAGPPEVSRVAAEVAGGRTVSALRWGSGPPQVVFLHGTAQNAHTWDTVNLALGVPALAVDLPGHGRSDWRDDAGYAPAQLADDVIEALAQWSAEPAVVVGMSLGGMTAMRLAAAAPERTRRLVVVDITPGVTTGKAQSIIDFVSGPESFASFDELLARTMQFNPSRSESSLRIGLLHNARPCPDGTWEWRYDRRRPALPADADADTVAGAVAALGVTWDQVAALVPPTTLVRGAKSPVVSDDDVAEWRRRRPSDAIVVVDGAGHSVQGDRPIALAEIVRSVVASD